MPICPSVSPCAYLLVRIFVQDLIQLLHLGINPNNKVKGLTVDLASVLSLDFYNGPSPSYTNGLKNEQNEQTFCC